MRIEQLEGKELYRTRPLYQSIFHDTELFTDFFYRKADRTEKQSCAWMGKKLCLKFFFFRGC